MDAVNEQALKTLAKYRDDGCHMLVPCMEHIVEVAQGFRLIVTPTLLRPHPRDKDVYPHEASHYNVYKNDWQEKYGEGKYEKKIVPENELVRISGQGLEKLAQNANIMWERPIINIDKDAKGRQLCEIYGKVRMPDGFSYYGVPDGYGMDLDIELEKLQATYIKPDTKKDDLPKKQANIDRDFLQKKTNQTRLIISGAKNRVIRKLLGIDNAYTVASLSKPFVSVRVIPWLDMNDEYTRRLVVQSQVAQMAITSIWGGAASGQNPPQITHEEAPSMYVGSVPVDKCTGDDPNTINAEIEPEAGKTYHLDKDMDMASSLRTDFQNSDPLGQCKTLLKNAAAKGYAIGEWTKRAGTSLEALTNEKRLGLYDHIASLPTPAGDVPFAMAG